MSTPEMVALRVEVRSSPDGFTSAALQMPDTSWMTLHTAPYQGSHQVRNAVNELARAIVEQMVLEATAPAAAAPTTGRAH